MPEDHSFAGVRAAQDAEFEKSLKFDAERGRVPAAETRVQERAADDPDLALMHCESPADRRRRLAAAWERNINDDLG